MYSTTIDSSYKTATQINESMGRVYGYMGLATLVSMLVRGSRPGGDGA
jgi:hypothetical protein